MEKEVKKDLSNEDFNDIKFFRSLLKGVRNIFILWLISKNKIHGYKIISQINKTISSNDKEKIVHGSTIYPILHSLENDGLITSHEHLNGNHKVKMYEITEYGIFTLNSLKKVIQSKPDDDKLISFIDDMIFNEDIFTLDYGDE